MLGPVRTNSELIYADLMQNSNFESIDGLGILDPSKQDEMDQLLSAEASLLEPATIARAVSEMPVRRPRKKRGTNPKEVSGAASKAYIVGDYSEHDVLLGRGGLANNNPGNKEYQKKKETMQERYFAATKEEKTGISQELVDYVHETGGRFLKLDREREQWYEVSNSEARRKASQTLRDINTPEKRAEKRAKYPRK